MNWYELFRELLNFNPLLEKKFVKMGSSYLEIWLLFCLKTPLQIHFVDKLNKWIIGRAHRTHKFLLKLVKGHCYKHLITLYGLINYRYSVLEAGASPFAPNRNWARYGTANQRTWVHVSYWPHSVLAEAQTTVKRFSNGRGNFNFVPYYFVLFKHFEWHAKTGQLRVTIKIGQSKQSERSAQNY